LIEAFGDANNVFKASPAEIAAVDGVGKNLVRAIARAVKEVDVEEELQRCAALGIDLIDRNHPKYPQRLLEIFDPPAVLYCQGDLLPQDNLTIAIVGTRHGSPYGLAQAERFAKGLARTGMTIVSGLARGIDAAAHRGALAAGGRTLAVLGSGIANLYPPEHRELADEIVSRGAVLSEFPSLQPPKAGAFPRRNRLISGMALGTLVIEAADRSGALISARHAMEQGRDVFALPGRVDNRNSRGCHRLIRDGAKLVESIDDILDELGPLAAPTTAQSGAVVHHPAELNLNEREQLVLQAIESDPTPIDEIARKTSVPIQQILATISALEMRRLVRRVSGAALIRL
jgi:DNA processing protein